jgi:phosphate transport system substrate-binding protein
MALKRCILLVMVIALALSGVPAWAGNIVIKGSTTVLPVAQKVAEAYMKEFPQVNISISGGGSGNGIKAIIDSTTDIANSSRFIRQSEVNMAAGNNVYPVPFAVAYDCIVPVVHPGNSVGNLTLDQLKAIYKGEITNWKEVGGPDLRIVVVSRDTSSGTYEVWDEKVMLKDRVFAGALLQASNGAVAQAVAGNRNAIGYIGLGYMNNQLKALTVNGVQGTAETTLSGAFPISRPLFMFTNGWPQGEVASFLNYLINPNQGQKLVGELGFVPLY